MQRVVTLTLSHSSQVIHAFSNVPHSDDTNAYLPRLDAASLDVQLGCYFWENQQTTENVEVQLSNVDGVLDDLLKPNSPVYTAKLSVIDRNGNRTAYRSHKCEISGGDVIIINLLSRWELWHETLISTGQYAYDHDNETLQNNYKPFVLGRALNCPAYALDPDVTLEFQVHEPFENGQTYDISSVRDNGAELTITTQWTEDLSAGTITLLQSKVGQLTVTVEGEEDGNGELADTLFQWGEILDIGGYDGTWSDITFTDAPYTAAIMDGVLDAEFAYAGRGESVGQVLQTACDSFGGWIAPQSNFGRLMMPHGRVVAEIQEGDIKALLLVAFDSAPNLSGQLGYNKNWVVQDEDSLATSLTDLEKAQLSRAYRKTKSTDQIDNDFYPAPACISPSLIQRNSGADAAIEHRGNLYREPRYFYELPTDLQFDHAQLGQMVRVTYPRYGLESGTPLQVVGVKSDLINQNTTFKLWGTGRYWPKAFQVQSFSQWRNLDGFSADSADELTVWGRIAISAAMLADTTNYIIQVVDNSQHRIRLRIDSAGKLRLECRDISNTLVLDVAINYALTIGQPHSFIFSADLDAGTAHAYIDDEEHEVINAAVSTSTLALDNSCRYGMYNNASSTSSTQEFQGVCQHFGLDLNYYDIDDEANRRLFFDKFNRPVDRNWSSAEIFLPDGNPENNLGLSGNASDLDGDTDDARTVQLPYVTTANKTMVTHNTGVSVGATAWYQSICVRLAPVTTETRLYGTDSLEITQTTDNKIKAYGRNGSSTLMLECQSNVQPLHKWLTILVRLDNSAVTGECDIYINDVDELDSILTNDSSTDPLIFTTSPDFEVDVGVDGSSSADNEKHHATCHAISIYDTGGLDALSDVNIRRRFHSGNGRLHWMGKNAYFAAFTAAGVDVAHWSPDGVNQESNFTFDDILHQGGDNNSIDSVTDYASE